MYFVSEGMRRLAPRRVTVSVATFAAPAVTDRTLGGAPPVRGR
jgi:hypothetical protein